jgi:hypothetical protein
MKVPQHHRPYGFGEKITLGAGSRRMVNQGTIKYLEASHGRVSLDHLFVDVITKWALLIFLDVLERLR